MARRSGGKEQKNSSITGGTKPIDVKDEGVERPVREDSKPTELEAKATKTADNTESNIDPTFSATSQATEGVSATVVQSSGQIDQLEAQSEGADEAAYEAMVQTDNSTSTEVASVSMPVDLKELDDEDDWNEPEDRLDEPDSDFEEEDNEDDE